MDKKAPVRIAKVKVLPAGNQYLPRPLVMGKAYIVVKEYGDYVSIKNAGFVDTFHRLEFDLLGSKK